MSALNSNIVVQKYGGACLETAEKIRSVALDLLRLHTAGKQLVVIVSAMGKTTDQLLKTAYQVSPNPNRRELDMLLSTGERVSMSLLSMALTDLGVPAISFTGSQAGVLTNESHSAARIIDVKPIRVREELSRGKVVVLAGFQGVNPDSKEITTLGRGGSDTTAVAMAAALGARCEIIKEVDGVCSADPRIVKGARPIKEVEISALGEMCFWGAKVLHFRCVELARSQKISLVIKKWGAQLESTKVLTEGTVMEDGRILSVNSLPRVEHLEVDCAHLQEGFDKFAKLLKQHGLAWPQILASAVERNNGRCRLMFTADNESLDAILRAVTASTNCRLHRPTLSSVSLTCSGSVATDLPLKALTVLSQVEVYVDKYILSPHSLTVFLAPKDLDKAIHALHGMI